jgi:hypothetical protein
MDSIGLGSAIANLIYAVLILASFVSGIYFIFRKKILLAIFIFSLISNFTSTLYFMGDYYKYKYLYLFDHKIWPWINLALLILLIINFIKNKNVKKEIN